MLAAVDFATAFNGNIAKLNTARTVAIVNMRMSLALVAFME